MLVLSRGGSYDCLRTFQAAGIRLGSTIMSLSSLLTGITIAFIYGWKLTLVILCFVPALAIAGALQMKMLTGAAGKNREALEIAGKVRKIFEPKFDKAC